MSEFRIDRYKFSSMPALSLVGDEIIEDRGKDALLLSKDLNKKGILVKDLIIKSPSLKIRNQLLNIAKYILEDVDLFDKFNCSDRLPIDYILEKVKISRILLDQWEDYIITYVYLLSNPTYKTLSDYLRVEENVDLIDLKNSKDEVSYVLADTNTGIVVAKSSKSAIILTSQGEFKRIILEEKCRLGEEIHGKEKKSWQKNKFHIVLLATLLLSIIIIGVYKYFSTASTLVIETTSQITIDINSLNKIVRIKSSTEKGKKLINDIEVLDIDVDDGLLKLFEYANNNEMIPEKGVIITVVGEPLIYGALQKADNYLNENGIRKQMNNSGLDSIGK